MIKNVDGSDIEDLLEDTSIYDVQWSPDGEYVVVMLGPNDDPTLILVNVYDYSTREIGQGSSPVWQPLAN
jgi:hypothetical protein